MDSELRRRFLECLTDDLDVAQKHEDGWTDRLPNGPHWWPTVRKWWLGGTA